MMMHDRNCDTCGKPATIGVQDIQEVSSEDWREYTPKGTPRYGCNQHPVYSSTYDLNGNKVENANI